MKICPQCQRSYPDDLSYCLSDGTPLTTELAPEFEEPTVVRPVKMRRDRTKTSLILLSILAGVLTLALGATIGILYVFWPRQTTVEQAQTNSRPASPTPTPVMTPTSSPSPTPTREATPTPRSTETPDDPVEDESVPELGTPDPPTSRIAFRKGRSDETISGTLARTRSFVLYARGGQTLRATIRSDGDCVSFEDGSERTSYATADGDNGITIVNNCDSRVSFDLSVRIR